MLQSPNTEDDYEPPGVGDNGGPPLEVGLTAPQYELVHTSKQFPAMVAGFGAGKTNALIHRALYLKFKYPTCNVAYYLPTYDLVRTIAFPRFEEVLGEEFGMIEGTDYKCIRSLTPMILFPDGGHIIMRTMDNPGRIVGYEVADSLIDELDTLKTEDASAVWKKIIARNRQKKLDGSKNTIAVGTTPEGFRFVYEQWKRKPPSAEYYLIKATTYSNGKNLPDGYIQDLIDTYPPAFIAAYLNGDFVNLTSGTVYGQYDRIENRSLEEIIAGEALHIGLDFNVTKMAAVIHVQRAGYPHAVAELINMFDTPHAIQVIKERFVNHPIFIYPDASGAARKSVNASVSDIALLQAARFTVVANSTNPAVKDRVLSMNVLFNGGGKRLYKVNDNLCPHYAQALEQQAYDKNGEPDKSSGLDHVTDAAGYFISYRFPVVKRGITKVKISGA